jgi:hypothetical protein
VEVEISGTADDRGPALTPLELRAVAWLEGFYELEHLLVTRRWVAQLRADASPALLFAALVHDAERHFPGGPSGTPDAPFDDPDYLFAHSIRSADVVEKWLRSADVVPEEEFVQQVRRLVLRHEIGGGVEADVLQAADSLSFLETLSWLTADWVASGRYGRDRAMEKLRWSVERIRLPEAVAAALPLYDRAVLELDEVPATSSASRRRLAGDSRFLLSHQAEPSGPGGTR